MKFASFKIITRSITAEGPVAYDEEIFALAQKLMQSVKWIEGVRLLGVSVAHLEPADAVPVLNFAEDERLGKRNQVVDILSKICKINYILLYLLYLIVVKTKQIAL